MQTKHLFDNGESDNPDLSISCLGEDNYSSGEFAYLNQVEEPFKSDQTEIGIWGQFQTRELIVR